MSPRLASVVDDVRPLSRRRDPHPARSDAQITRCPSCGALTLGPCTTPHHRYIPTSTP